jgi:hypothetical protein
MIERTILMGFTVIIHLTTLTAAGLLQSGQPIRIPLGFGTTDLNGDGASFCLSGNDRFPGESRNNDRLPWSTTFDLGATPNYDLWK